MTLLTITQRRLLKHFLHPVHLWCLLGGGFKFKKLCQLYEKHIWVPFLQIVLLPDGCKKLKSRKVR